ncbi:hypothetical protein FDP41_008013 [Naegleria fowleri]|uniref:Methyltransferase domain-containing protein n=1 Tax=Naegleria fowleri TaxID=5763 RepID=A0A6A5CFC7_NAEFO|nr:uncharacterized protein FDP41_008013 [Naegleria fowleri]KAF0984098.1 hypothetical protein FDP41_008013 [Naegleria fowleri]CAG4708098.1 unnamed protein product [Naegleria fowleri]
MIPSLKAVSHDGDENKKLEISGETNVFLFDEGKLKGRILKSSTNIDRNRHASLSKNTFQPHDGSFRQGDYVWTLQSKKLYAIGRVLEFVTNANSPFVGRYKIEYCKDKSRYHCKAERMVPIFRATKQWGLKNCGTFIEQYHHHHMEASSLDNGATHTNDHTTDVDIIVCNETSDFRLLAKTQVFNKYDFIEQQEDDNLLATTAPTQHSCRTVMNSGGSESNTQIIKHPGDFVLEIGSALGETSKILHEKCAKLLCLDISKAYVEETKKKFPFIEFWCADIMSEDDQKRVIRTWRKYLYENPSSELKVFIDINGNRMLNAVLHVVEIVKNNLKPSLIVVKSSEYYSHLRNSCCEN